MSNLPEVSVIMPTKAMSERAALIQRALDSILSQERVRVFPIVVVNGVDRDPSLTDAIVHDRRLEVIELEPSGIPGALRAGREAVTTEWFASLDDDDQFLPGALSRRVEALRARNEFDTVITNGILRSNGVDRLHREEMASLEEAPLDALAHGNWLLPGAWLCRTDRVGGWLFDDMPNALECTYLAIRFAQSCKACFLDEPTVVWHRDTPGSASKSRRYILDCHAALGKLLALSLPARTKRWLSARRAEVAHRIADAQLHERQLACAWRWHLRSLSHPAGWRYLTFTLRLFLGAPGKKA